MSHAQKSFAFIPSCFYPFFRITISINSYIRSRRRGAARMMLSTRSKSSAASEAELTTARFSLYASTTPSSAMLPILLLNRSRPELLMPLLMAWRRRATRSELSRPALSARMVGSWRRARANESTADLLAIEKKEKDIKKLTKLLLSSRVLCGLLDSQAHGHLGTSTTKSDLGLLDGL